MHGAFQRYRAWLYTAIMVISCLAVFPQSPPDSVFSTFTLQQCVDYALKHQPLVNQSTLDEAINKKDIAISLSGWLPQVNLNADLKDYLRLPVAFFPNANDPSGSKTEVTTGLVYTSDANFSATQSLYSNDLAFAGKAVHNLRLRAAQNTENTKIATLVNVSKSFYNVMLAIAQLDLENDDIRRLETNYKDAHHLFESGLTDKIDYQQAQVAVNNAKALKRNSEEAIKVTYSVLKQQMGYPPEKQIRILFDSASFEKDILADTLKQLNYEKRIEYQQSQTDLHLQNTEIGYYRWSFLPNLSAFYYYNFAWYNNNFAPLFTNSFPNSVVGLTLSLPIFQGTSRIQKLHKAHLVYQRLQLSQNDLKSRINTQFTQAMASYKSNLYALGQSKANSVLAGEIFSTVSMQYIQGVKTYLDLIVAETDLRNARLNYLGSLFQVLSSTLDLKAAMGDIIVN
jgi:outer membrane protein